MIIYLNSSDFSRQFFIVYFTSKYWCHSTLPTNLPWILIYLYYKYSCTAHYSSATFWIWFCLDLIKVIALAHLAIISTKLKRIRIECFVRKKMFLTHFFDHLRQMISGTGSPEALHTIFASGLFTANVLLYNSWSRFYESVSVAFYRQNSNKIYVYICL
jgi:hypothetical protein